MRPQRQWKKYAGTRLSPGPGLYLSGQRGCVFLQSRSEYMPKAAGALDCALAVPSVDKGFASFSASCPLHSCKHGDFAPAGATRGLSDRPLDPFGAHPYIRGRNLSQGTRSLWRAGESPFFAFLFRRGFRLCGGDQRAFRSPFGNLRVNMLWRST